MRQRFRAVLALAGLAPALAVTAPHPTPAEHWQSETPEVFVDGTHIHYYGLLNEAGAERLRDVLAQAEDLRALYIASPGGNVLSSIDIGQQIQARDLAVVVVGEGCASGCANYVFTPARQRTISEESLVLWHYSCPPRKTPTPRRMARQLRRTFGTAAFTFKASDERGTIEDPDALRSAFEQNIAKLADAYVAELRRTRQGHDRLFAQTGIDDRIICLTDHLRLPKVPEQYVDFLYTLSLEDMARFGVCDVDARPDYGTWAAQRIAADETLSQYGGVVALAGHPRFRPRPSRVCSARDEAPDR